MAAGYLGLVYTKIITTKTITKTISTVNCGLFVTCGVSSVVGVYCWYRVLYGITPGKDRGTV